MQTLIVLAHPEPSSFNAQLKDVAVETLTAAGHSVEVSDLCALGFDPVEGPAHYGARGKPERFEAQTEQRHASEHDALPADVAAEVAKLEAADLLILQFPMWWFSMPAMLKGWIDRVFVYGRIYRSKMRYDAGYFRGRRALVSTTTGAPAETHGPDGRNADIELLLWPLHFTLFYVGYDVLPPFVAPGVEGGLAYSAPEEVARRLDEHKRAFAEHLGRLDRLAPLGFNGWEDWDEAGRLKPDAPSYSPFVRHPT